MTFRLGFFAGGCVAEIDIGVFFVAMEFDEGEDLCVDFIRPLRQGERSTIINGWTICLRHYVMRNDYGMSELDIVMGMFANLQEAAIKNNNQGMQNFFKEVTGVCKNHKKKSAKQKR